MVQFYRTPNKEKVVFSLSFDDESFTNHTHARTPNNEPNLTPNWINMVPSTFSPLTSPHLPTPSLFTPPRLLGGTNHKEFESDRAKEKFLSDAAATTPQGQNSGFLLSSCFPETFMNHNGGTLTPSIHNDIRLQGKDRSKLTEKTERMVASKMLKQQMYQYQCFQWFKLTNNYLFSKIPIQDKILTCLQNYKPSLVASGEKWFFLMHQVFEVVFPKRARSSIRLRMEFLEINNFEVADYHLVHKLKELKFTKLHTGTLKLVLYKDLLKLIISIRKRTRFQTGGSQKSKDAIEKHVQMVNKKVLRYENKDLGFLHTLIMNPESADLSL